MLQRLNMTRARRGAVSVEAAVLISFLLLPVIAGVWEVGRLVETRQILDNACREAGRQASTGARTASEVQQTVLNYLDRNLPPTYQGGAPIQPSTGVTVTITNLTTSGLDDPSQANQLDHFRIQVVFPSSNAKWIDLPGWMIPPSLLTAVGEWYSMKDLPLTVPTDIPIE